MKAKVVALLSLVFAVILVLLTAPFALGCSPDGDGNPICTASRTAPPGDPVVPQLAALNMPKFGTQPDNAVAPTGSWITINPNESHWFKMSDAGMQLQVWIDANGQGRDGLSMSIFAPDHLDFYGKPVGRGSYNPSIPSHDLFWTGSTLATGVWYAQVTDRASIPISYSMNYKRVISSVAARCSACHGYSIEWDRCTDNGSPWCENLLQEYDGH